MGMQRNWVSGAGRKRSEQEAKTGQGSCKERNEIGGQDVDWSTVAVRANGGICGEKKWSSVRKSWIRLGSELNCPRACQFPELV
jgi:hypothetical protein